MRRTRRQLLSDVLLWAVLSVLVAAAGPDPVTDLPAFLGVTGARVALVGVAVAVGRPWPPAAVLLLSAALPPSMTESLATSDVTWLNPALVDIKVFPVAAITPGVIWYSYLTGRRMTRQWPALAVFAVVTAGGLLIGQWITVLSGLLLAYVLPYGLGLLRRGLSQQRERATQSAEAQARLRERTRIAHDMHDSLGHDLALIAVRAAALEMMDGAHAKAAGELREAASAATERLREIIGLLREDGAAPLVPVGEDVAALVARARDSGMTITLTADGAEPALAHRVVQEGLTNAAKHAPGARVAVSVTASLITVRNGPPAGRHVARSGGLGLAGLRERVRLAGGTLEAGPDGDGYLLTVKLPHEGEAPPR
ncbi:sensor histidine kinase [Nonomuraea soli]|uniref:histidine kinase n=1 Tax=Nonomuraea soli TaxID=1032476 RepID=A0A7W0CLW9_9ACTN|nr:histidine kinase [Nonomuraea soli]MBA2893360.1 signal transduction histidine kinase [Nonomuraea soli]